LTQVIKKRSGFIGLCIGVIFFTFFVAKFSYHILEKTIILESGKTQKKIALSVKKQIEKEFKITGLILKKLAESSHEVDLLLKQPVTDLIEKDKKYEQSDRLNTPEGPWNELLTKFLSLQQGLADGFYFINKDNICLARMKWRIGRVGKNFDDRLGIQKIAKGDYNKIILTTKIDSYGEKMPSIAMSYGYSENGKLKIITRAIMHMDVFSKNILRDLSDYHLSIQDSRKFIIADTILNHINKNYKEISFHSDNETNEIILPMDVFNSKLTIRMIPDLKELQKTLFKFQIGSYLLFTILALAIIFGISYFTQGRELKKELEKNILAEKVIKMNQEKMFEVQKMDSIGLLAGGIAHDFNNILGGIMGYADLLLIGETNSKNRKFINTIITLNMRGKGLTEKLLGFAKKGKNLSQAVSLNTIVNEVYDMLERTTSKYIVFRTDFEKNLYLTDADPNQIMQVVLNLCINSIEAMPNGGTLCTSTKNVFLDKEFCYDYPKLTPGSFVRLTIEDTGHGIDKQTERKMFEPYFSTKIDGAVKGTGLGLSTVYGIVKNHEGIINSYSELDKGANFIIHLPKGNKMQTSISSKDENLYTGSAKILIVEDEKAVRDMAKHLLERLGYSVITACDGIEGVEIYKIKHNEIDLVILDMIMPKMNGKDAFLEMQKINPNIKSLVSTGYSENEEVQEMLNLGVNASLSKPYRINTLSENIKQLFS
jgi:signal transduction histidine kinase/CheY-like chemotaxis protein